MNDFYDGTKVLSLKDLNGNDPEMIFVTSNRSAGKSTWFNRYFVKRFKEHKEKFMLLYRFKYELNECEDKFFKDIKGLFFPEDIMTSKTKAGGMFVELYLNDESCGYVTSLNSADGLKKYSHFFSDTTRILFDEFQSEQNSYCDNEISKFISLHTTVSRGNGQQSRFVPVFMLSNNVTILNPYYTELHIAERLSPDTNFLRGNGWVLEQGYNDNASSAVSQSVFMQAFADNPVFNYTTGNKVYLYSNDAFIEKLNGTNKYICSIRYENQNYAIRYYEDEGLYYCDTSVDNKFPIKISITSTDHNINYVMLNQYMILTQKLRQAFELGLFRFKNEVCKTSVINFLRII